jgi:hypothetical protein
MELAFDDVSKVGPGARRAMLLSKRNGEPKTSVKIGGRNTLKKWPFGLIVVVVLVVVQGVLAFLRVNQLFILEPTCWGMIQPLAR